MEKRRSHLLHRIVQILRNYVIEKIECAVLDVKMKNSEEQIDSLIQFLLVSVLESFLH